jgi:hypothetical protein
VGKVDKSRQCPLLKAKIEEMRDFERKSGDLKVGKVNGRETHPYIFKKDKIK